ncbi:unknown similar to AMEV226 [Choristoneura biennis entomopoxvirus]|uniref:Uncharacterized protein n=1 Tax=Choristoneura biennis entomopoxvirus TaxID=10288 RepID=A0A916P6Z9_CBEPV|nr:unknown similar to AMEV226 [Choristoneura biennis entomopoxvirus]CCU55830.1 unknown similar to AMEV226 [Choristoneura biennis entomopoxvirus]
MDKSNNIFYLDNIYKKYRNKIKDKKLLKKFNKMYKLHTFITNILKTNDNVEFFDKLLDVDKKIYTNIYLIKLKYELLLENTIINILGYISLISYIVNKYYNYNVDNSEFLKLLFNNINITDNTDYIKYIDNYKIFIIHIINTVISNNETELKTSINDIIS